jgi:hypothetical protein
MVSRLSLFIAVMAAFTGVVSLNATGAWALTMQECSAKYKAAQTAGTLNGKTWNQFRKDECGATAAAPAKTFGKSRGSSAASQKQRGISNGSLTHLFQGVGWEGAHAHVSGPVQGQQSDGSQWRSYLDPKRRGLLQ